MEKLISEHQFVLTEFDKDNKNHLFRTDITEQNQISGIEIIRVIYKTKIKNHE